MSISIVKIYGSIFDWTSNSSQEFIGRLSEAAKASDVVELHFHSYGGSVIEGNMIVNAIKKCKKPVHAYIDGVAASMAAMIAVSAEKVYMAENAMMMIHAPSGVLGGRGTLKDFKGSLSALAGFEKSFVKLLIARTGKSEVAVREWLDADTWFSSEDALAAGLIDGIVDPIAKGVELSPTEDVPTLGVEAMYNLYTAELLPDTNNKPTQKTNQMDKGELIKTLGLTGVTAESSDVDLKAAIATKQAADKATLEKAQNEVKAQTEARITAAIEPYKEKITVDQRKNFEAIGQTCGIDALNAALAPFASQRTITDAIATASGKAPAANGSWTLDEWQEKDPRGLEKLAREDHTAFSALYQAKFGVPAPR